MTPPRGESDTPSAGPQRRPEARDDALIRATQMAVEGADRPAIEAVLRAEFGLEDASELIDDLLTEGSGAEPEAEQGAGEAEPERIGRQAREAVEAALAELARRAEEVIDDQRRRLREEVEKVRDEIQDSAQSARAAAEEAGERIEAASETLEGKARRHELKLVRAESSRRMSRALEELEEKGRSWEERLSAAAQAQARDEPAGEGAGGAWPSQERDAAMRGLEDAAVAAAAALERIAECERRIASVAERVIELGRHAGEALDAAAGVEGWERRIASAARAESEATRRILAAERRLLERLESESGEGPPSR